MTAPAFAAFAAFLAGAFVTAVRYRRQLAQLQASRELLTQALRRNLAADNEELPRALEIGTRITTSADEIEKAARAVGELLRTRSLPETAAVAVVVCSGLDSLAHVEYCSGIPQQRISESLLALFDTLRDGRSDELHWGSCLLPQGTIHDLSVFGIGSIFTAPIAGASRVRGMIWLGFEAHRPTLSREKLRFLHDVCEHCSAAFETADKVQARLSQREHQRDVLLGMSHDLRAPGNSALYALRDLLSESTGPLSADQRLRLRIVEECLEDQLDTLSDIIDYTRNQRGLLNPAREPVRLSEVLPRIFEWFRTQAEQHGLRFDSPLIPPLSVLVDPRHFKRIISNLLSNAVKYTDRGFVAVEIRSTADTVVLSFVDSGIGIPDEEQRLLFREFSRLSTAAAKQGSGLGLVIARELARANGGELRYRPRSGGGSIFELEILRSLDASETAPESRLVSRILVVDDDAAVCRTNRRFLDGLADEVITATSSVDALRILEQRRPELLVSDLHLGASTAESLLDFLCKENRAIPTVVLTGSDECGALKRFDGLMPIEWIRKPAGREALQGAVRRAWNAGR